MNAYNPDRMQEASASQAYSVANRIGVVADSIADWSDTLLREPRVCVPIDVQALVVAGTDPEDAGVRLTGALTPGRHVDASASLADRRAALSGADPFTAPTPRDPGVHLHWAMPDALMAGKLKDPGSSTDATSAGAAGGGLDLPALPDRWTVIRLLIPVEGTQAVSTGWVIDALTGAQWQLGAEASAAPAETTAIAADGLTGTAGGTLTWTAGYDAAQGRFTFRDPLSDLAQDATLAGLLPGGPLEGRATYLVVGWWTDPALDPLDEVRGNGALAARLEALSWYLDREAQTASQRSSASPAESMPTERATVIGATKISDYGLEVKSRYVQGLSTAPNLLAKASLADAMYIKPQTPPRPEASTLVHGAVVGVPVLGADLAQKVRAADQRPGAQSVSCGFGETLYDAVGAMTAQSAATRLGAADPDQKQLLEELLTAFSQHALQKVAEPGGAAEIDEDVHASGFTTVASGQPGIEDRVVDGKTTVPAKGRRIGVAPGGTATPVKGKEYAVLNFGETKSQYATRLIGVGNAAQTAGSAAGSAKLTTPSAPTPPSATPSVRSIVRPDPSYYVSSEPYVAVRGAGRALRNGGDGRWLSSGKLQVRHPSEVSPGFGGVIVGADVLPAIASGAIPAEATALAREALLLTPHAVTWLAQRAATAAARTGRPTRAEVTAYRVRLESELLLRYDVTGGYTPYAPATVPASRTRAARQQTVGRPIRDAATADFVNALSAHSVLQGTPPSPVGITAWSQPWCPMWLEYTVEVKGSPVAVGTGAPGAVSAPGTLSPWDLGGTDLGLYAGSVPDDTVLRTVTNRVPLTTGAAIAVGGAIDKYLVDEHERDTKNQGEIDDPMSGRLAELSDVASSADLLGASLDGVHNSLLGFPARSLISKTSDGSALPAHPDQEPVLLTAGSLRIAALRIVDTFGRVMDLDPSSAAVPSRLVVDGHADAVLRAPRFVAPSRVRIRLVGSEARTPSTALDARIDEADPTRTISPVAGFLLPDHVDESIEVFGSDASPLGELLVTGADGTTGGGVVWEPAPGRPVAWDASPTVGIVPAQAILGDLAAGLVLADARARKGERADPDTESALSALLRAIDTTLWTVDPISGAGSAEVASIVGRPLAVVRALVQVDIKDDLDSLDMTVAERAARKAAYDDLAQVGVRVRLGELTRPDDGLVGWYADDDYSAVHLVDAAVADLALPSGPGKGFLTEWGVSVDLDAPEPITHPYILPESELVVHPGVPRMVTLLMAPGAAVYHTSGVVPRGRIQLQRGWFADAVDKLVPSVRVGPVLIDPGDVRLPLVAALGAKQTLTVREGPIGWRDDAILAAGSSAVLPDRATVLREGWIRVTPAEDQAPGTGTS